MKKLTESFTLSRDEHEGLLRLRELVQRAEGKRITMPTLLHRCIRAYIDGHTCPFCDKCAELEECQTCGRTVGDCCMSSGVCEICKEQETP